LRREFAAIVRPDVRPLLSSITVIATLAVGCVNAPSGPPPCGAGAACTDGTICVVGRCRLSATSLVGAADGRRLVVFPDEVAVSSSRDPSGGDKRLPAVVVLGRGSSILLLHFAVPISEPRDVGAAILVLEPPRDALAPASPVPIHLARIVESWQADAVSDGRVPRVGVPERAGVFDGSFGGVVRIDVTSIVKRWAERRSDDHGIAVVADEADAYGAAFSLGVTEGRGPRLEVYLR